MAQSLIFFNVVINNQLNDESSNYLVIVFIHNIIKHLIKTIGLKQLKVSCINFKDLN